MAEPLRYAVLLSDPAALKPAALMQALAPALGRPAVDLAGPMRRCWGLVEADTDEPTAKLCAKALCDAGLPALALPKSLLEEPPAAEPLRALPEIIRIRLLAAAMFRETTSRVVKVEEGPSMGKRALRLGIALTTGIPLGSGKREVEKRIESTELAHYLDVYAGSPLRRWRIDAAEFDFSCLGPAMGYDAFGNFRKLIQLLAPRAARVNHGARALQDGKPARDPAYESLADLDREGRWLLTLDTLQKPG